jgi:hypothetical protein
MMTWEQLQKCTPGRIDELNDDAWTMIHMIKTLKSVREFEGRK